MNVYLEKKVSCYLSKQSNALKEEPEPYLTVVIAGEQDIYLDQGGFCCFVLLSRSNDVLARCKTVTKNSPHVQWCKKSRICEI